MRKLLVSILSASMLFGMTAPVHAEEAEEAETVSDEIQADDIPAAESFSSDSYDVWVKPNDSTTIECTFYPENSAGTITWSYQYGNYNDLVTIDENNVVHAGNKTGRASFKGTLANGFSQTYMIYVAEEPESFSISGSYTYTLPTGSSKYVHISVMPYEADRCRKHITVDHPEVVSVGKEWTSDSYFEITGLQEGKAVVTVEADNGVSTSIEVEVIDGIADYISPASYKDIWLKQGESTQLEYSLSPSSAVEKPVFKSSDEDLIRVDQNGVATAVGTQGFATVTASIRNGSSCDFKIYINENPAGMHFEQNEYAVRVDSYTRLNIILEPANMLYSHITFTSSDPEVADYGSEDGRLHANKAGTAVITATADNGVSCEATVHVEDGYATSISADQWEITMDKGETVKLPYTLHSSTGNTDKEKVTFAVLSGDDVVSVDEEGNVTAVSYGQATVAALISGFYSNINNVYNIDKYNSNDKATFTVYVGKQPEALHFASDHYECKVGQYIYFHALSDSADGEFVTKEYSSSDPSVIEFYSGKGFEASGRANKAGTAVITAKAENGVTAETTVTVTEGTVLSGSAGYTGFGRGNSFLYVSEKKDYSGNSSDLSWISRNEEVATVDNGIVTGVASGSTMIEAYDSAGNLRSVYPVCVGAPKAIHFTQDEYYIAAGSHINLDGLLYGESENELFEVTVKGSDDSVFQVNNYDTSNSGTAIRPGDVTLTAVTRSGLSAQCVLHVGRKVPAEKLELAEDHMITIHTGSRYTPQIRVLPNYSDLAGYTLKSSDPDTVSVVPEYGINSCDCLQGNKPGTAKVTAVLKNNPDVMITFDVAVEDGQGGNGAFANAMYRVDDGLSYLEYVDSAEEYTCYVGERYVLNTAKLQTRRAGQEFIYEYMTYTVNPIILNNQNNCVAMTNLPGGAVSGPSVFDESLSAFCFVATRPGTATVKMNGNRTYKIHVVEKGTPVSVYGNSLALEGKIGVNYYLDIPQDKVNNTDIHISLNGQETVIHAKDAEDRVVSSRPMKLVSAYVSAKEMRDSILLYVTDSDGRRIELLDTQGKDITDSGYEFSVAEYFDKAETGGSDKLKKLAKVMDTYGKYAQIYFNYNTEDLTDLDDVSSVTAETVEKYKAVSTGSVTGLNYLGGSLELSADTSVRIYFKVDTGHTIGEFTFKADGKTVKALSRGNGQYYVAVDNIAAQDLHKEINFTAQKGNETIKVTYYPLSYAYSALSSTKTGDAIKNTCRALYLYNQQAISYFSN